jgi:hypothetical protein
MILLVIIRDKKQVCFWSSCNKKKKGEKYSIFFPLKRSIKKIKKRMKF